MAVRSEYPSVFVPRINFTDFVLANTTLYGHQVALINATSGEECTYSQLTERTLKVAAAFHSRGLQKGDVVCVFSKNDINFVPAMWGIIKVGGIITTCNPVATANELAGQLEDSSAKYIITGIDTSTTVTEAMKSYRGIKEAFIFGAGHSVFETFSTILEHIGPPAPDIHVDVENDVCLIPYSSGTTGKPKGVMLTHYNMVAQCQSVTHSSINLYQRGDVVLFIPPFFHIYGLSMAAMNMLQGNCFVFLERFELGVFMSAVSKYKATKTMLVPPVVVLLAKHPDVSKYDLSSLSKITVGAAPLGKDVEEEITNRLPNVTIHQGYGMTEISGVSNVNLDYSLPGSIGKLLPNYEAKVVDVTSGRVLGPGEEGEILFKTPQTMKGYLNRASATQDIIDADGYLHTGDIGYYDKDGFWYIVDRLKELIKYKGFQVAPAELEALLLTHPGVADAAVIGVPDVEAGELPCAYIVRKLASNVSEAEIQQFVGERLSQYKKLRGGVRFVAEIPKSASGKILRRILKDELMKSKL